MPTSRGPNRDAMHNTTNNQRNAHYGAFPAARARMPGNSGKTMRPPMHPKTHKEILRRRRRRWFAGWVLFLGMLALCCTALFFKNREPRPPASSSDTAISSKPSETTWALILANTQNPLPENYESTVTYVPGPTSEQKCDARILEPLTSMFNAAAADGIDLYFRSGYRSFSTQTVLFEQMYEDNLAKGMTKDEAYAATKSLRNVPGTSEHETGLAVDIVPLSTPGAELVAELEDTKEIQWLHKHCAEYGFILRYPKGKTDITGTEYEPWHFRYVGVEDAGKIMAEGLTLEEYLARSNA